MTINWQRCIYINRAIDEELLDEVTCRILQMRQESNYPITFAVDSPGGHFDVSTAQRLGKRACVKILSIEKTRKELDKQLGCKGVMKACAYTESHQRNHFLKSAADKWQDEYRIFWKRNIEKRVKVPAGTAELTWVQNEI